MLLNSCLGNVVVCFTLCIYVDGVDVWQTWEQRTLFECIKLPAPLVYTKLQPCVDGYGVVIEEGL